MKFLTANWKNLIVINYKVKREKLTPFLPKGTFLDDFENEYFVSLIGFMFENTKVLGVKFPYHINFEEVNLRFYVRDKNGEKGVVFIKEIVPKRIIKSIANYLFHEHYSVSKMNSILIEKSNSRNVSYEWKQNELSQQIKVKTKTDIIPLPEGSKSEFIAEHYLGFTKVNENKTTKYKVEHPRWKQSEVIDYDIDVDFKLNYGEHFSFLDNQSPDSVYFLKGSEISVSNKQTIK